MSQLHPVLCKRGHLTRIPLQHYSRTSTNADCRFMLMYVACRDTHAAIRGSLRNNNTKQRNNHERTHIQLARHPLFAARYPLESVGYSKAELSFPELLLLLFQKLLANEWTIPTILAVSIVSIDLGGRCSLGCNTMLSTSQQEQAETTHSTKRHYKNKEWFYGLAYLCVRVSVCRN